MIELLSLLLMSAVSILGLGAAINFFAQTGFRRGCGWGTFLVGCFLFFWVLGLWEGVGLHAWGVLGFAFILILVGGWVVLRMVLHMLRLRRERRQQEKRG